MGTVRRHFTKEFKQEAVRLVREGGGSLAGVDALIPALYLNGLSTGDFQEALAAILGPQVVGLSAANIVRLKAIWEDEYRGWCSRDLSHKRYVYWWAGCPLGGAFTSMSVSKKIAAVSWC